ncbi:MAG: hypothetical protein AAFX87_10110 [Bacteroidota bacterium]
MKNLKFLFILAFAVIVTACHEDGAITEPETNVTASEVLQESKEGLDRRKYCFPEIIPGRWVASPWTPGIFCNSNLIGICSIEWHCFVPPILIDPCLFVPCWFEPIDPWIIYPELDPRDFASFPEKLELEIDPRVAVAPFRINEVNVGLQFYAPIEEVLNEEVFLLENDLDLGKEFAEQFKLQSSVIPAGKYPVVFNGENKTFNVVAAVGK